MGVRNMRFYIGRYGKTVSIDLPFLTEKELILLRMLMQGMNLSDISQRRERSVKTISTQKRCLYKKLGIKSDITFWADIFFMYSDRITISSEIKILTS
ncbi:helix-turn-helix domain-containing protein [Salmonella enterica]|nr:helix-turn-helix domain-containing protein [Salmonella enterica]